MQASIVTGASRGIGRAIALKLAAEGPVVLVGTRETALDAVRQEVEARGQRCVYVVGDVAEQAESPDRAGLDGEGKAAKAVGTVVQALGWEVRNLILNAGISKVSPTAAFTCSNWRRLFDVNVHGSFYFVKEFLPGMLERKDGAICFLAGKAGIKGYPSMAGYCASKHALVGLAQSLAAEVGRKGIRVTALCPGPTDTEMTEAVVQGLVARGMTREAARDKLGEENAFPWDAKGRLLNPDEVAEAVVNFCYQRPTEPTLASYAHSVLGGL
jgi:3-oxoacyl-[acyl-carrier protein] reductase